MATKQDLDTVELRRRIRHSAAHVMADVVTTLFPDAKLAIGPPTDDGFYYDFLVDEPFSADDLQRIEDAMRGTIERDLAFELHEYPREQALAKNADEPLKLEIIEGIPEDEPITTYKHGEFEDLCVGPHVQSTGRIPAFKLLNVAGAYWRGDENRPMLQRIYGTAFESQEALDEHLHRLEEARRRDHRTLGSRARPVLDTRRDRPRPDHLATPRGPRSGASSKTSGRTSTAGGATSWSTRPTLAGPSSGRPAGTWSSSRRTCTPPWTWTGRTTT